MSDSTLENPATPLDTLLSHATNNPSMAVAHLVEAVQRLSLAKDISTIMAIVRSAARELTGADGASFVLRDGEMCFYADEDAIGPLWKGQRFPLEACISGWVIQNARPVSIPDIYQDARIPAAAYRPTFVRSLAMVPIRTSSPIGAIGIYWATPHTPAADEVHLLQALADSTAVAMDNIGIHQELEDRIRQRTQQLEAANQELRAEALLRKRMEAKVLRLSLTDELTGLSNRRGFLIKAEQLLKLVRRVRTQAWLVYIDLDRLKQVNDRYGHDAGDHLIRSAARVLRETFRDSDILSRIGGDEFVVFASGTAKPADEVHQRLDQNIAHHNQCFPSQPPLAMSIGLFRCDPYGSISLEDMIHQADAAMYIEKRRKRAEIQNESTD